MEGDPKFQASQDIPDVPYHAFAQLIGLKGVLIEKESDVAAAWDTALGSDRPVVLEFKTDPNIAPLPPHITLDQAKKFATSMFHGDVDRGNVIVDTFRQVVGTLVHS